MGKDVLADAKDAYMFVVEKVPSLLGAGKETRCEKVIFVGQSAGLFPLPPLHLRNSKGMKRWDVEQRSWKETGAYFALLCGHYVTPRSIAILGYHSVTTITHPIFNSSIILGPPGTLPIIESQIQPYIDEPATIGATPPSRAFNLACLNADLSRNVDPNEKVIEEEGKEAERMVPLVKWFFQTNKLPEMLGDVDKGLGDGGWKKFPETVLVVAEKDMVAPPELSVELAAVMGESSRSSCCNRGGMSVPGFYGCWRRGKEGKVLDTC
jgi:hypothetical protein